MIGVLFLSYFGLDHMSRFEIIHIRIDDCLFVWYCFYVQSQILQCITCTKILSKFQIILKLPTVKSWEYLSELAGTEFNGSLLYQSMKQFGVPCVKRGEELCYFDCIIFYFGWIKLLWYSR